MNWLFLFSFLIVGVANISAKTYVAPQPEAYLEKSNEMRIKHRQNFQALIDNLLDGLFTNGFDLGSVQLIYHGRESLTFLLSDRDSIETQVIQDTAALLKSQGYYLYCNTEKSILMCKLAMTDSPEAAIMPR
jgi:hypothetical protein